LDPTGAAVSDSYVVASVRTQTTLVLSTAMSTAIVSPIKMEIRRDYTKQEQANNIALRAGGYDNRRVMNVFPNTAKLGNVTYEGYYVAAAVAGLASGVVPHQPLTNLSLLGFSDVSNATTYFTEDQLNTLAEAGVFIVTQEVIGSTPYVRHQLTTDTSNLNFSERSVTSNVDSISYGLQNALKPYIGKYNLNENTVSLVRFSIERELNFRASNTFTVQAGNQLINWELVSVTPNIKFRDRLDVVLRLTVPYPLNDIDVTLLV